MSGPLEGFRIVDTTAMITGPLATMMLADQGADVIKVEPPGLGDVIRYASTSRAGIAALFANCNRSKRSVVLNLREPRGVAILEKLVAGADVFVQNFRPGVVERLGIDEPTLRRARADLVYVSISAFGHKGPYAKKPAYDHIVQAVAGFAAVQADRESRTPAFMRTAVVDKATAYAAAQAITAALLARERSGEGQHVRLSMLDVGLAFLWPDGMMNHTLLGHDVLRGLPIADSYRMLRTTDGYVAVAAMTDAQFHGLFRALGRGELVDDPRFGTLAGRIQHGEELYAEFDRMQPAPYTTREAMERLEAEDVPCAVVEGLEGTVEHPQVRENGILEEYDHPVMGRTRQPRPPVQFRETPGRIAGPVPLLGEHTDAVLAELGIGAGERAQLRADGIIGGIVD